MGSASDRLMALLSAVHNEVASAECDIAWTEENEGVLESLRNAVLLLELAKEHVNSLADDDVHEYVIACLGLPVRT